MSAAEYSPTPVRSTEVRAGFAVGLACLLVACRPGEPPVAEAAAPDASSSTPSVASAREERAACSEVGEGGLNLGSAFCRHHVHPCCLDAGSSFAWSCDDAEYAEWHLRTFQERVTGSPPPKVLAENTSAPETLEGAMRYEGNVVLLFAHALARSEGAELRVTHFPTATMSTYGAP